MNICNKNQESEVLLFVYSIYVMIVPSLSFQIVNIDQNIICGVGGPGHFLSIIRAFVFITC